MVVQNSLEAYKQSRGLPSRAQHAQTAAEVSSDAPGVSNSSALMGMLGYAACGTPKVPVAYSKNFLSLSKGGAQQ